MKLLVSYYRGVKNADIDIENVSLIAGKNHQGKSSIANAFGSVLTGTIHPDYILKKDLQEIVNTESGIGKILLTVDEDATAIIDYPLGKLTVAGQLPKCSLESAGMRSPVTDMDSREKAKYFSDILNAVPTKDQLKKAIKGAQIPDAHFEELWKLVLSLTWDGAFKRSKDTGTELKGVWKHVTAETYGKNKGEIWKPEGWIIGLEAKSLEDITNKLESLKKERDKAVSASAIDGAERKRLQSFADGAAIANANLNEINAELMGLETELDGLISKTPTATLEANQECPHCSKPLNIESGKITKGVKSTPAQIKKVEDAYAKHIDKITKLRDKIKNKNSNVADARKLFGECADAEEALKQETKSKKGAKNADDFTHDIEYCEFEKSMLEAYLEARKAHNNICANAIITNALSPEGLRKETLMTGLDDLNTILKLMCEESQYGIVKVTESLDFVYNDRRYEMLSESEKFRVRVSIQIACCIKEQSAVLIIDGADILDADGRQGLISILNGLTKNHIPVTSLVCMSMSVKTDMPDMSVIDGFSHWIEDGEVK